MFVQELKHQKCGCEGWEGTRERFTRDQFCVEKDDQSQSNRPNWLKKTLTGLAPSKNFIKTIKEQAFERKTRLVVLQVL